MATAYVMMNIDYSPFPQETEQGDQSLRPHSGGQSTWAQGCNDSGFVRARLHVLGGRTSTFDGYPQ